MCISHNLKNFLVLEHQLVGSVIWCCLERKSGRTDLHYISIIFWVHCTHFWCSWCVFICTGKETLFLDILICFLGEKMSRQIRKIKIQREAYWHKKHVLNMDCWILYSYQAFVEFEAFTGVRLIQIYRYLKSSHFIFDHHITLFYNLKLKCLLYLIWFYCFYVFCFVKSWYWM